MEQLGKYTLLRKLGDGGMAEVYLAEVQGPLGFSKRVALKRIHRHLTADRTFVDSLINEARLGGHLNHHNIVQTLDFGVEGEFTYVAMEYIPGVTLGQILSACWRRGEPLPPAVSLQICIPIADALDYAHSAEDAQGRPLHMIHRDLKPSNILISPHGAVKLADFGVARASSNVEKTELAGSIKGTIHYMSPEQANGVLELDGRADLFSLGVILYELLANERLYPPGAYLAVLKRVQEGKVGEALERLRSKPHGELLYPILSQALAFGPEQRFPSAHAMSEALHRTLDSLVQTQPSPGIRSIFGFPEISMLLQPGDETSAGGLGTRGSASRPSAARSSAPGGNADRTSAPSGGGSGSASAGAPSTAGTGAKDEAGPPMTDILLPVSSILEEDPGAIETRAFALAGGSSGISRQGSNKAGDVLSGRYRLLERIGQGGMGEVYRAEQLQLGRQVAVKLLMPADAGTGSHSFEKRFLEEAARSSRLQHPNIVTIYDYGQSSDGRLYLVMELLEGESLQERLSREGAQPLEKVLTIGRQVCAALAEAHAQSIIHRDVTPANLFLCQRGTVRDVVKILDFGLAQQASAEVGEATTQGIRAGSPAYMSPEQVMGEPLTPASDLYALGLVLYQLVTGKLPFDASDTMTAFYAHLQEPPPPPSQRAPGLNIPSALEQLILQCLAKKPEDRPAGAQEISTRLDGVEDGLRRVKLNPVGPVAAAVPTPSGAVSVKMEGTPTPTPSPSSSNRWVFVLVGLLVVLGAAALGAWMAGSLQAPAPQTGAPTPRAEQSAPREGGSAASSQPAEAGGGSAVAPSAGQAGSPSASGPSAPGESSPSASSAGPSSAGTSTSGAQAPSSAGGSSSAGLGADTHTPPARAATTGSAGATGSAATTGSAGATGSAGGTSTSRDAPGSGASSSAGTVSGASPSGGTPHAGQGAEGSSSRPAAAGMPGASGTAGAGAGSSGSGGTPSSSGKSQPSGGSSDLKGWDSAPSQQGPSKDAQKGDPKRPQGDIRNPFDH